MTVKPEVQMMLEQMEANPEIAQKLNGLSLPDRIMVAEALINCGEWPAKAVQEDEYDFGFPVFVNWQVAGVY